ncbi:MAG TPA: VWA domain-containing protein [Pyrinomonadaceae bacterium]|nr:VWA domain-containing protein [Pyrinomonadaceae bacterium]
MKYLLCSVFVFFIFTLTVSAQTIKPNSSPASDDDVVKISSALVQIDVTALDKDGKQIPNLTADDFEVFENGKLQKITNFSYVALPDSVNAATPAKTQSTVVPPVNFNLKPEKIRRTVVLIVDDLGLSFGSMFSTKEALKKFVDEQMLPDDLVAIIRTSAGLGALQQFTSDKRILYAAIKKISWNPLSRSGLSGFEPIRPSTQDYLNGQQRNGKSMSVAGNDKDKELEQLVKETREGQYSAGTLGAMRYVVEGMKNLPGRKAIILFSDGFKLFNRDIKNNQSSMANVQRAVENLTDAANRTGVVINSIDASGLLDPAALSVQDDTIGLGLEDVDKIERDRRLDYLNNQGGLSYLAYKTGGRFYKNGNFLDVAVSKILNDQKGYYLIGYQPDDDTFDYKKLKYNSLEIKSKRADVKLNYRKGFIALPDEKLKEFDKTPEEKVLEALFSPFNSGDIDLRLTSIYLNDEKEGSYVRALMHVDSKNVKFVDQPDGSKKVSFDVFAYTFGESGKSVGSFSKNYTISIKPENLAKLTEKGFAYTMKIPVKDAGAYQLRIAVRDVEGNKIGSASQFIEIPNLQKEKLAISGMMLQNLTPEQWQKKANGGELSDAPDTQTVTATRVFRRGTILFYSYILYNRLSNPALKTQAKLYRDGELVFEGKAAPIDLSKQTDLTRIESDGAITLGNNLSPGNYVLQIIVENAANNKNNSPSQWIDFELTQ